MSWPIGHLHDNIVHSIYFKVNLQFEVIFMSSQCVVVYASVFSMALAEIVLYWIVIIANTRCRLVRSIIS
jgi:hypothetical protein